MNFHIERDSIFNGIDLIKLQSGEILIALRFSREEHYLIEISRQSAAKISSLDLLEAIAMAVNELGQSEDSFPVLMDIKDSLKNEDYELK